MTERDKRLIESAKFSRWEDIDEDEADTAEAREVLHDICMRKYHRDEYELFMD